jgi:hybrid cluster-associated redox disulfide protein
LFLTVQAAAPEEILHMTATEIDAAMMVDDVMRGWPATIRAFLDHRMNCPGCPIACFHTVADACREHNVDPERFLRDLRARAAAAS